VKKTASAPKTKAGRTASSARRKKTACRALPRVLVVEDDALTQFVALKQLEKLECVARGASNGFAALEACRTEHFDLILMDCRMPYLNGFETARSIRTHERSSQSERVTIVAITGETEQERVDECMSAGMDGHFSKPIGLDDMRALLSRFL
jgi:CheY-like chemotaxis protein